MHIEFLVEEPSAEVALLAVVPRIIGAEISFSIHSHQGKLDLLGKLPSRLRGYAAWLPHDWRIVVLLDRDADECRVLKAQLEQDAAQAGLTTRATVEAGAQFQVLNRLAIEELEAWFFGDCDAIGSEYPRVPKDLVRRAKYRDPDDIQGGTWEALERELQRVGYHQGGLAKITAARDIATHMQPERNRSRSFQAFRQGLLGLVKTGRHPR